MILVVLKYLMLHTKFQGHRSTDSGEEDFKLLTIYGHGCQLCHEISCLYELLFPCSYKLSNWISFQMTQNILDKQVVILKL